jgi:hypothetical protein
MTLESEMNDPSITVEETATARGAPESYRPMVGRRSFLSVVGKLTASATVAGSVLGLPAIVGLSEAQAKALGPLDPQQRRVKAFMVRVEAAKQQYQVPVPPHPTNGDEQLYCRKFASYSKGLVHKPNGEVEPAAYQSLIHALETGNPADFDAILVGGPNKLVNPQSGLAYDLEGTDSHQLFLPPPPRFASAEEAGEMVELYWMALLRDVPYLDYGTNPLALQAIEDLNALSAFRGPRQNGQVTPDTLFRSSFPGALVGPYFSQFWWLFTPFGAERIDRHAIIGAPDVDYMTTFDQWLTVENGQLPQETSQFDPIRRLMFNGRSISGWVHFDVLFQAYFEACLIMVTQSGNTGIPPAAAQFGLGVPYNAGNPYNYSPTQVGFGTFGVPMIKALMCEVATRALKAVWFQKWFVHRRLRPEEFGERVDRTLDGIIPYPINEEVLDSQAVQATFDKFGTFFLPQAFPEGCPVHPAYGSGHATVAGACVTIRKAMFDGSFVIPNPVMVTPDGLSTVPYDGPPLTVGGELDKHATNVAFGRSHAGVHWRSDADDSLRLGEKVAISILRDMRLTYNEPYPGLTFRTFDGVQITV